jgi:hypothetical protein
MLKKILLALGAALLILVAVVATRPATYRVERAATIPAAPDVAFALVNDFHRWAEWSPWDKLDPAMKKTHGGAAAGTGATYEWAGNSDVGHGRMTITESKPGQRIAIQLEFIEPWTATNQTEFTFAAAGAGTKVVWAMTGHNDFMGKAFSLFMNMDRMIGADFEKGLAAMAGAARGGTGVAVEK